MSRLRLLLVGSALLAGASAVSLVASCSFTTSFDGISGGTRPGADGSTDTSDDAGSGSALPPVRPAGATTPGGGKTVYFGVKHLHFAHSNDSLKIPGAWQDWGYDVDRLCTGDRDGTQEGTCIRAASVTPDVVKDGKSCRDNQLGAQIVPQLNTYNDHFENDTNSGLLDGAPTLMFQLDDLADGADDAYVPGRLYLIGRTKGSKPAWDGTDVRDVIDTSVEGSDLEKPLTTFPSGYLKDNVWVSGEGASFSLSIPMGETGELLPMKVRAGVIAFKLNDGHGAVLDGTGVMAGAFHASDIEDFLRPFLLTQTSFCPGTAQYDIFMKRVVTFVDVELDVASLQDPKLPCNGLSFGLGMNMSPIARPTTLTTPTPPSTGGCGGDAGPEVGDTAADAGDGALTDAPGD